MSNATKYAEMTDKEISIEIARRVHPYLTEIQLPPFVHDFDWKLVGRLIKDKKICLNYVAGEGWFACSYFNEWLTGMQFMSDNPLRAAAEVWLMINDKERGDA